MFVGNIRSLPIARRSFQSGKREFYSFQLKASMKAPLLSIVKLTKMSIPQPRNVVNSIHQLVEWQAEQTPDAVAVIFRDRQLTYRELNQQANQLAHHLRTLGVGPEVLVGICVERSHLMVVGILGIVKAGGAYVPLDIAYPKERLGFIIEDTQLSVLLTQQHLLDSLPECQAEIVDLEGNWHLISRQSVANCISDSQLHNLAYVIYTSGSTGRPKGVAIEHRNTVAFINWAREFFTPDRLTGVLASTSLCFDLSIFEIFVTLSCGGRVIVAENALELPHLSAAKEVTLINTVPSAIASLLRTDGIPASVRTINLAGEPLQNALVQKLYRLDHIQEVFNLYGPSEDTTYSTVALIEKGADEIPPIGRPISNTQIYLLTWPARRKSDVVKPIPEGMPGEIYIGGAGLARGYLNRPDLTAEKFIANPFSDDPEERLYKTGDLAVYLPDGSLKFLGRIDDQVKIRGFRVELGDIEAALNQYPKIRESVVLAKEDQSGSKRLVAYFVPTDDGEVDRGASNQLEQWTDVWNTIYAQPSQTNDPTFNTIGWNDSFRGLSIPDSEMREWVDFTVERILSLRPQQVLEIGCGIGLLLFKIAPHCTRYVGLDISERALDYIKDQLQHSEGDWSHVELARSAAHELDRLESKTFDTIVLNSVIQYFPSVDYLVEVVEKAVELVKPGGKILLGDVRSLPLLETFHAAVQLTHASDSLTCDRLQQQIQQAIDREQELVIHPDFFIALKDRLPRLSHVQILLKRGHSRNEMVQFRSDIILHVDAKVKVVAEPLCWDWQQQSISLSDISRSLQKDRPNLLKIINIPNERVLSEVQILKWLASLDASKTVGDLRADLDRRTQRATVHPESFWSLSQKLSYGIDITWSGSGAIETYDVVLKRESTQGEATELVALPDPSLELKPWSAYANNPLQANEISNLIPEVRAFLQEKLPDYMIPALFVVMENFPLTPNGKIDKRSLPEPQKERPALTVPYVRPSTPLEKQLTEIWSEILDIENVGIHDNFFELGGNSLLVAQLVDRVEKTFDLNLPLFYFFKEPTIIGTISAIETSRNLNAATLTEEKSQVDLKAESILDPTIQPETPFLELVSEPRHIFLTGATGFLGAFLLYELIERTQATIYCLVRGTHLEETRQKIRANLERYELWDEELNSRIIPILGDLAQPRLGLTEESFRNLGIGLDLIYHCGAFVNLIYPYTPLRAVNVLGTQEVLRLASQGKPTPVNFISTIDVLKSAAFQKNIIYEDEPIACDGDPGEGYIQTKWVAEQLVIAAKSRGIPVSIYRPGIISGHSQTGVAQTNDVISRMIRGIIELEAAPNLDRWVNLTPVDYVSKAIVYLSRQPESLGKTFHIINPEGLHWKTLIDFISGLGYPMRSLSYQEWQTHLLNLDSPQKNPLHPILSLVTNRQNTKMTALEAFLMTIEVSDSRNTLAGLRESSLTCPSADDRLLNLYFAYFTRSRCLKLPTGNENMTRDTLHPDPKTTRQAKSEKKNNVVTSKSSEGR